MTNILIPSTTFQGRSYYHFYLTDGETKDLKLETLSNVTHPVECGADPPN